MGGLLVSKWFLIGQWLSVDDLSVSYSESVVIVSGH